MGLMISSDTGYFRIYTLIPIHTLARICFFVAKPQDLPTSRQTLIYTIAATVVVLFICYSALPGDRVVMPLSIAHVAAMGLVWMLLLRFHNQTARWYQSAVAIYGCSSLINLAQLPLVLQLTRQTNGDPTQALGSTAVVVMFMWFWEIAVVSSIMRQTLEVRRFTAVALSLAFTFAIHLALLQVFGHART